MKFTTFENLIEKINTDLADFKGKFAYKRKELAELKKAPNRKVFFKYTDSARDWAINEGGGTEIQYHLFYRDNTIGYGLGFNAQYVPYANDMSPVEYIKSFVTAYLNLSKQNNSIIKKLKSEGFSFIVGKEKDLVSIQKDDYYLFGKEIKIDSSNNIPDNDYNQMIDYLQNDIYNLYVDIWTKKIEATKTDENMVNALNILTANHNLILTGAPGTGKTYLAKQIAQQMIFGEIKEKMSLDEEKQFNEQCGFVQFHPSYDYTDFVEGLRPVQDETGNVGFERKDGVFKEFCKKAILQELKKDIPVTKVQNSSFDTVYKSLVDDVKNEKITHYKTTQGTYPLSLNKDGRLLYREKSPRTESKENMKLMYDYFLKESIFDLANYDKNKYWNLISRLTNGNTKTIDYAEYGWTLQVLLDRAKNFEEGDENHFAEANSIVSGNEIGNKSFVFIIDEINRGEINKIFGELFFSIDPGYRGEKGRVQTQYQNIVEDGDIFKKGFFVPENVYIIGTMNDIDRSVESMDFAFRRRFAFKEIKAIDRVEMLYDSNNGIGNDADEAKERMNRINKEIEKIEGLSTAYHIGPAYFLKLKNYNGNFQQLWENHLEGLLREYLRGMQNLEEKLKTLKAAYDNESDSANGQQQE